MKRFTSVRPVRFLLSGGINTGATYALYLVLIQFLAYPAAYTATYLAGIALSYWLNAVWVFQSKPEIKSAVAYPIIYVGQYLLGIGVLSMLVEIFGIDKRIAPILVVICTFPIMYFVTKYFFSQTGKNNGQGVH